MVNSSHAHLGITLIELLVSLSITLIIISYGTPQLMRTLAYFESRSEQQSLLTFIATARSHALYQQQIITLCPLTDELVCSTDWNGLLTFFTDANGNAQLDTSEEAIATWQSRATFANLSWTLSRRYMRFRPNGSTTALTGSLRYCTSNYLKQFSFRLVIARTGRTRVDRQTHGC